MKYLSHSYLFVSALLYLISAVSNVAVADNLYENEKLIQDENYHFRNIYSDGLSSPTVKAIIQDRYGFVWIGNSSGVDRYDGKNFLSIKHSPLRLIKTF